MKKIFDRLKNLWSDESAQGATEYILLLAILAAIVIAFKGPLTEMLKGKLEEVKNTVTGFKPE
jgi:Flp pilus assembly pilin Flp